MSEDLHAQAGHIGELVETKVMAQLPTSRGLFYLVLEYSQLKGLTP